jgi:hypothetical protein
MTPLDEGSAHRRELYLTTHNTRDRQTSMPPAGFDSAVSANEQLQTLALDRSTAGIGTHMTEYTKYDCVYVYESVERETVQKCSSKTSHIDIAESSEVHIWGYVI